MQRAKNAIQFDSAQIERRLAEALRDPGPVEQRAGTEAVDVEELSSRELLQMAWDRTEDELDQLQAELRRLRQLHQEQERALLARINEKKRLQKQLLEHAPERATG
jgi:hypothetical protein